MLRNNSETKILSLFLVFWLILQFISAYFTELYNDEAYYWVYSQYLDWGYFDHPPMVGSLIRFGSFFSENEVGVRLSFIILSTANIYLFYKIVDGDVKKFIFFILGTFPFHLFGFMALPDMPFLFFATLFFYVYQKYLEKDTWGNAFWIAVSIAGMFYSKYHAILIVLFTIFSNWRLLQRKTFYFATIMTLVLFAPNIVWQIVNDYPSVQYHLFDRSAKSYDISFTLEYIGSQLFFYGPFLSLALWFFAVKTLFQKSENLFVKTLKYNLIGVFLFFLFMTFKGRVEVNWTLPLLVPLFVLAYSYIPLNRLVIGLSVFTFVLTTLVRIHLVIPFAELERERGHEFRGHKKFAKQVKQKSEGLPIVANTYQRASVLYFYLKEPITSLNVSGRKNLFGMLDFADTLECKKVAFVQHNIPGKDTITIKGHKENITIVESLPIYRNVSIHWKNQKDFKHNPKSFKISLKKLNKNKKITCEKEVFLTVTIKDNDNQIYYQEVKLSPKDFEKEFYELYPNSLILNLDKQYSVDFMILTKGVGIWWKKKYFLQ